MEGHTSSSIAAVVMSATNIITINKSQGQKYMYTHNDSVNVYPNLQILQILVSDLCVTVFHLKQIQVVCIFLPSVFGPWN